MSSWQIINWFSSTVVNCGSSWLQRTIEDVYRCNSGSGLSTRCLDTMRVHNTGPFFHEKNSVWSSKARDGELMTEVDMHPPQVTWHCILLTTTVKENRELQFKKIQLFCRFNSCAYLRLCFISLWLELIWCNSILSASYRPLHLP